MSKVKLIRLDDFCLHHQVEVEFISQLQNSGLVELITIQEKRFVPITELAHLEQIIRFHYDLDINLEGIETVTYLLQKNAMMQMEITRLKNRLRIYELENIHS